MLNDLFKLLQKWRFFSWLLIAVGGFSRINSRIGNRGGGTKISLSVNNESRFLDSVIGESNMKPFQE